jgi:hypothetical protein
MKLHIGQGTTVGAITIFPVWHDRQVRNQRRYDTGATALEVSEVEHGPLVGQLSVKNVSDRPVLVLDGQLFEGGWQHRMATRSTLVPAQTAMALEVACVEQHRWHGATSQRTGWRRATTVVRAGYDAGGQHEVWRRIERYGHVIGRGSTGSLADRLGGTDVDEQTKLLARNIRPLAGQCGVLIGIGGQPLALEVFDHPATLVEQYRAILRAAVLDALGAPAVPTPGRRARRFAERLALAELDLEPNVGQVGRHGRASTAYVEATSLRHGFDTVHLRATYRRHPLPQAA